MPDYLTRVVMAGARTGEVRGARTERARMLPVRVTAAMPSAHSAPTERSADALPPLDDVATLTLDVPRAVVSAPHREETSAIAEAPVLDAPRVEEQIAPTTKPPELLARILAPQSATHVVRMPRDLRPPMREVREAQEVQEVQETHEHADLSQPQPHSHETIIESSNTIAPIAKSSTTTPAIETKTIVTSARPESVEPIVTPRVAAPSVPNTIVAHGSNGNGSSASPQRRVTIGKLELQVQHVPPPQTPAPLVRPPRKPAVPASAIEGHFLDGLQWKL